jgi:hypothetical protein
MAATNAELGTINAAITVLCNLEGQNRTLVCEMAQAMLGDLIDMGRLESASYYVTHYCSVLDGPADAIPIVAAILEGEGQDT